MTKTKYLNFIPTDGFRLYVDSLIGRVLDFAPSDSASFSEFERRGKKYSCKIEIISAVRRFEALIESASPKSALEEARRRIIRQLARWRRERFTGLFLTQA